MKIYDSDKPENCKGCYFWKSRKDGCGLDKCYYLSDTSEKPKSDCDGCPYGRNHPCIGWCTKQLLQDMTKTK